MLTYTYLSKGKFGLVEKTKPVIEHERDAIVKVTLASICSSDLHIKHGSVPRAVPGITVGHEMVGIVEDVGTAVTHVKPGDHVTVNVETFCGECFFCKRGFVNNCTDENGGWALGCRIDGGQAEYVRVPFADQGLNKIPDNVTDRQALLVGDVLATGFWAAKISEITEDDTVLIIGAGPTGICTLLCVMLKQPKRIIVCEKDENRIRFVNEHYPDVLAVTPEECLDFVLANSDHGGADVVLEVAGSLSYLNVKEKALLEFLLKNHIREFAPIDISRKLGVSNKTVINRCMKLTSTGFLIPNIVKERIRTYSLSAFTKSHIKEILAKL